MTSRNICAESVHRKPRAGIDTIELFCRFPPKGLRTEIEKRQGGRVRFADIKDKLGFHRGTRIIINRPTIDVLDYLALVQKQYRLKESRIDIAFDLDPTLRTQIERHLVLRWRRKAPIYRFESTVYWHHLSGKRPSRSICLYDRIDETRLELRFLKRSAVVRAGLILPHLRSTNPAELFRHQCRWVQTDQEKRKAGYIRKEVAKDIGRQSTSRHDDLYRSHMSRRAGGFFDKVFRLTAQQAKDAGHKLRDADVPLDLPNHLQVRSRMGEGVR